MKNIFLFFLVVITIGSFVGCEKDSQIHKISKNRWVVNNIISDIAPFFVNNYLSIGDTLDFRDNRLVFITSPNSVRIEKRWDVEIYNYTGNWIIIGGRYFNELEVTNTGMSFRDLEDYYSGTSENKYELLPIE